LFPDADNNEGDYDSYDEKADDGHDPIKVPPPYGTPIANLIACLEVVRRGRGEINMAVAIDLGRLRDHRPDWLGRQR
jgi:hypothetical protein